MVTVDLSLYSDTPINLSFKVISLFAFKLLHLTLPHSSSGFLPTFAIYLGVECAVNSIPIILYLHAALATVCSRLQLLSERTDTSELSCPLICIADL